MISFHLRVQFLYTFTSTESHFGRGHSSDCRDRWGSGREGGRDRERKERERERKGGKEGERQAERGRGREGGRKERETL